MLTDTAPVVEGRGAGGDGRGVSAPYMSFQGFRNLLDRLATEGLPQVFDRSFFGEVSGSLIAQTRGTLTYFELIDDAKRPTARLESMAGKDEQSRIAILRELAEAKYADVLALGTNATQGQLEAAFRTTGLSGASITKAITFYMGLAEYVALPVSPFFKKTSARPSSGNGNSSRRTVRRKKVPSAPDPPLPVLSHRAPILLEEKKSAYIDLLMKLAEQSAEDGQVQQDLLNRLERALGYEASP